MESQIEFNLSGDDFYNEKNRPDLSKRLRRYIDEAKDIGRRIYANEQVEDVEIPNLIDNLVKTKNSIKNSNISEAIDNLIEVLRDDRDDGTAIVQATLMLGGIEKELLNNDEGRVDSLTA